MELLEAMTKTPHEKSGVMPDPGAVKRVKPGNVKLKNLLLLTDFSPSSELALPYAVALAQQYGGKVYVAHVISPEMYEYLPPELVSPSANRDSELWTASHARTAYPPGTAGSAV